MCVYTRACIYTVFLLVCVCHPGNVFGPYKVHFSLEIICEPAGPIKVIDVQCAVQVSSANLSGYLLILSQNTFRGANICVPTFFQFSRVLTKITDVNEHSHSSTDLHKVLQIGPDGKPFEKFRSFLKSSEKTFFDVEFRILVEKMTLLQLKECINLSRGILYVGKYYMI